MPTRWMPTTHTREAGGRFQIIAKPPGRPWKDITIVRGAPTIIGEYSTADPFGWAGARLDFPQLTGFDAFGSGELYWLTDDTDIDIWWIPSQADATAEAINPLTQAKTDDYFHAGAEKVWEGFTVSPNQRGSETEDGWGVDLLGALYQADGYLARPMFPARPISHETLLTRGFSRTLRPHLRTSAAGLKIEWPAGWSKIFTAEMAADRTIFTPMGLTKGQKYSGYSTRQTGGWDAWLTSFAQDLISVMWVDDKSGVTPGNQWTLLCDPGRQPVLRLRDRFRAPDFSFWYGTPGMTVTGLSRDSSQSKDVLYGEGSNLDGTVWRTLTYNEDPSFDSTVADYIPLVASLSVHPTTPDNTSLDTSRIIRERMVKYAPGISKEQAQSVAGQQYAWDIDPGWTGQLELKVDPGGMNRWTIKAGMAVRIKGVLGSGEQGVVFHINETTANPEAGTVTCKIDTKFRDLLSFEEAVARTRDPLLPSKILQINRTSVLVEDQMAPWDYAAGSGFMPTKATSFFDDIAPGSSFPWAAQAARKQPGNYPQFYVRVNADSSLRRDRWTVFPIIMSERGTASHLEIAAFDKYGDRVQCEFHLSLYYINVTANDMPFDGLGPSPFIDGAFQTVTPTGAPMPPDHYLAPAEGFIIGWGDSDQPAGYSPGAKSDGDPVTGRLVDSATWTWDMTNNSEFDPFVPPGKQNQSAGTSAFSIYGALYAEWSEDVYFIGRIYRQAQGTS